MVQAGAIQKGLHWVSVCDYGVGMVHVRLAGSVGSEMQ